MITDQLKFDNERGCLVVEIILEVVSKMSPLRNFSLKLSSQLILKFCFSEVNGTVFVGSWENAGVGIKVLVSLLTFSIALDTIFDISIWVSQAAVFLPGLFLCSEHFWSLKKIKYIKILVCPRVQHCICILTVWFNLQANYLGSWCVGWM